MYHNFDNALKYTTDTKSVEFGIGAISRCPEMFRKLFPGKKAIVIADSGTWKIAGEKVFRILDEAGIEQDKPYVFTAHGLYSDWTFVEELDSVLSGTDAVPVAVGAGVINDLTKISSYRTGRRYVAVATAASMDGYTAFGAPVSRNGNKDTFSCPAPLGVVFDLELVASAPVFVTAAGYGDLMAKIPAGADWILADALGIAPLDKLSFTLSHEGTKEALSNPEAVRNGNLEAVGKLSVCLLMSGFAMQVYQSSRPASGAEHQFSRLWDVENLTYEGRPVSHGFKVGIGTLASVSLYEMLLETDVEHLDVEACIRSRKSWDDTEREIRQFFGDNVELLSRALVEAKAKYLNDEDLSSQLNLLKSSWPCLRGRLAGQILPYGDILAKLKAVGAPYEPEHIGVSREYLRDSFHKIAYLRRRFTIIDLVVRCGLLDDFLARLFGPSGRWEI